MVTQLHLALILAIDAKLLVLDEPTLGLDLLFRRSFYDNLLNDYFDKERTILVTTHQVEEIENILTDVLFIQHGKIVLEFADGSARRALRAAGARRRQRRARAGAQAVLTSARYSAASAMLFDGRNQRGARRTRRSPRAIGRRPVRRHDAAGRRGRAVAVEGGRMNNMLLARSPRDSGKTARCGSHRWSLPASSSSSPRSAASTWAMRGDFSHGLAVRLLDRHLGAGSRSTSAAPWRRRRSTRSRSSTPSRCPRSLAVQLFTMVIVLFFYLLDSLLAEAQGSQHPVLEVAAGVRYRRWSCRSCSPRRWWCRCSSWS